MTYDLVVVGASWGGLRAVSELLASLPRELDVPLVLAQHRAAASERDALESLLRRHTHLAVREASDKDRLERGTLYVAPPDYHLLLEEDGFALSTDERVQFARPSIDVLFESAADAHGERTIAIVLTGANEDGAAGLRAVKDVGGVTIVQDPETAEARVMPDAALRATAADAILPVREMGPFLWGLCGP
jgi:two-component system, chemotaxis family, protein-glutamate methylesterase/glutaminase